MKQFSWLLTFTTLLIPVISQSLYAIDSSFMPSDSDSASPSATTTPIRTKYHYEGPDGCTSKDCSCRTETKVEYEINAKTGVSSGVVVKTLKCKNETGTFLVMKIPQMLLDIVSGTKEVCEDAWEITVYYVYQGTTIVWKKTKECASVASGYWDRITTNIGNAFHYVVDNTKQTWKELKHKKNAGRLENLETPNRNGQQ